MFQPRPPTNNQPTTNHQQPNTPTIDQHPYTGHKQKTRPKFDNCDNQHNKKDSLLFYRLLFLYTRTRLAVPFILRQIVSPMTDTNTLSRPHPKNPARMTSKLVLLTLLTTSTDTTGNPATVPPQPPSPRNSTQATDSSSQEEYDNSNHPNDQPQEPQRQRSTTHKQPQVTPCGQRPQPALPPTQQPAPWPPHDYSTVDWSPDQPNYPIANSMNAKVSIHQMILNGNDS